jgi:uncharacterized RDD family membrane protein YckC
MQWTDDLGIETPEQIEVALEIAGLGSRFVAQVCDWLIKWLLVLLVGLLGLVVLGLCGMTLGDKTAQSLLAALGVGFAYAVLLGFDIYYEVRHSGQTPGKRWAGIRVVRENGAAVDFRAACVRNLVGLADFLPGFYLLGALFVLLSGRGQRLGDMAAGTIVIRERTLAPPAEVDQQIKHFASDAFCFTSEQLGACSSDSCYILRSFFQRHTGMAAGPRQQLARRLAEEFLRRTAYQPVTPIRDTQHAVAFLASLYRDLQTLAQHGR